MTFGRAKSKEIVGMYLSLVIDHLAHKEGLMEHFAAPHLRSSHFSDARSGLKNTGLYGSYASISEHVRLVRPSPMTFQPKYFRSGAPILKENSSVSRIHIPTSPIPRLANT